MKKIFYFISLAITIGCFGDIITGTVVTSEKKPLGGARVTIFRYEDVQTHLKTAITDKNGRFRFDNLETGYYRIVVSKATFCDEVLGRIEVNQPKFGIVNYEIVLSRPGSLSGFVYDPEGKPVSKAEVFIGNKKVKTDTRGFYRAEGLKPGLYYIHVVAMGFVKDYKSSVAVEEGKETAGINFNLCYAGSTRGTVVDLLTGKPIKDVQIDCSGPIYVSGKTDENGIFSIDGLKQGTYTLYFYKQGYEHFRMNFSVQVRQAVDHGEIRLKMRDKYFNIVLREWIFTPQENIKLYFNAFRVSSFTLDIYEVDIFDQINKAKSKKASIQSILESLDGTEKIVFSKKFDISYPTPLTELYDRKIAIGMLPEGVYVCKLIPDGLPVQKTWFVVSDIGFVSKSVDKMVDCTVFCISRGNILADIPVYIFDQQWNLKNEIRTDTNGQFKLETGNNFLVVKDKSIAFSESSYIIFGTDNGSRCLYAFTDRPVYRPGQTVYFKGIPRVDMGSSYELAEFSNCAIKIISPDGEIVYETMIKPANTGSVYGQWVIPEEPQLGTYTIEFLTQGRDQLHGQCIFKILEYRKPDFFVEVVPEKEMYLPGENIRVRVSARYYFGAPVKNTDVMWAVYSKNTYDLDNEQEDEYSDWWRGALVYSGSAKTDENGLALFDIPSKSSYQHRQIYLIEVRMTDLSRREIIASRQITILPGCYEIIVSTDRYIYSPGEEIFLTISTKQFFDDCISQKKQMTVFISQEHYDAKRRRWSFSEILRKKIILVGEKTIIRLKPVATGYVKISVQGLDKYSNIITGTRYVWITGSDSYLSWVSKKEIELVADKKVYNVGDMAKILINTRYKNIDLLFTIEGQKLFESRIIKIGHGNTVIEVPIRQEHIPNFYVSICGVKNKNFIYSSKQLKIDCKEKFIDVEILPEKKEFQPAQKAFYTIKTTDLKGNPVSAEFSIGVVDESIYSISGELVPRIEDFFYGVKANRVSTSYSFYRWYYGGPGKDFAQSDIRKKFEDTAFWLPFAFTDQNGLANVRFEFPDNLTTWRATVRAISSDMKVGTGIDRVITTKPLVARLITPRFFVEDDRVVISGVIHNRTKIGQKIFVKLVAEGLEILDEPEKTIELDSERSERVDWKTKVKSHRSAKITLFAWCQSYKDAMELVLPIFSYGAEERHVFAGKCDDTKIDTFYMPAGTISASIDAKSYIYPSLVCGLLTSLEELANYPYGCVEQTLNAFLPAIQVAHTLVSLKNENLYLLAKDKKRFEQMKEELPKKVADGLIKLYKYQREDGGWGWWQNEASNPYTTGYVVFGLAHAKKCGYMINPERFERAKNFLRNKISSVSDYNQRTFLFYALTYAGEKDNSVVEELYKNREKLNPYTLAQLCLILHQNNDVRAKQLLDYLCSKLVRPVPSFCYWKAEDGNYGWINNDIEATAWGLCAILAIDPKRNEVPGILRYLVLKKRGGLWYSTKDTAICLFAFTELLKTFDELSPDYVVAFYLNDILLKEEKLDRKSIEKFNDVVTLPNENFISGKVNSIKIEKKGEGNLYYSHVIKYSVKDVFIPQFDAGFRISRRYTEVEPRRVVDVQGNVSYVYDEIKSVRSGDRVRVEIKISGVKGYEYIMIEDPIPSGFEVVEQPSVDDFWWARKEIRDEKVAFFTSTWHEKDMTIEYQLRAETPGFYHILPAKVQLMYLPEIWGRSQGNVIVVE